MNSAKLVRFLLIPFILLILFGYTNCGQIDPFRSEETVTGNPMVALSYKPLAQNQSAVRSLKLCVNGLRIKMEGEDFETGVVNLSIPETSPEPEGNVFATTKVPQGLYTEVILEVSNTCGTNRSIEFANENGTFMTDQTIELTFNGKFSTYTDIKSLGFDVQKLIDAMTLVKANSEILPQAESVVGSFSPDYPQIQGLIANRWLEVPNTNLRPHVDTIGQYGNPIHIMAEYNGAAYDSLRHRLVIAATGGSSWYSGNEVFTFDVRALSWSRIKNATQGVPTEPVDSVSENPDGTPASRTTYGSVSYLPVIDRLWLGSGSRWGDGKYTRDSWFFNFVNLSWEKKSEPFRPYEGQASAYDSLTGNLFIKAYSHIQKYNPRTDTTTQVTPNNSGYDEGYNIVLDPKRRRLIMAGLGTIMIYSVDSEPMAANLINLNVTGYTSILSSKAPGLAYDIQNDRIVIWDGASDLATLNLDTNIITRVNTTGSSPSGPPKGAYGRLQYIPGTNAFIAVNSIDENVRFIRLQQQ